MSNCAVVVFKSQDTDYSPGIYLHWSGEEVVKLLKTAAPRLRKGDAGYAAARFCGVCHESIRGNYSLGLLAPPHPAVIQSEGWGSYGHGDAGVAVVNVDTGVVKFFAGSLANKDTQLTLKLSDRDTI